MSAPIVTSIPSDGLRERPLTPEEKARIETAEMLDIKYSDPAALQEDLNGARSAMGGVGEIDPESGSEIAENILNAEANDPDNLNSEDELDKMLAELDNGSNSGKEVMETGVNNNGNTDSLDVDSNTEQKITEGIYSPVIDKMLEEGTINNAKVARIVKETLVTGENVLSSIDSIPNNVISPKEKETITNVLSEMQDEDKVDVFRENFETDFGNEFSDFKNKKGEFLTPNDADTFDMIARNYITPLEGEVSPEEKKLALNTAFKTALNVYLDGKHVKRDETFTVYCKTIRDGNSSISEKFIKLKEIVKITDREQAKGGVYDKAFRVRYARGKLENIQAYEKFQDYLAQFKNSDEKSPEAIEIAQSLEEIRKEAGLTIPEASLLAGGEMDIMSDITPETPQKSA